MGTGGPQERGSKRHANAGAAQTRLSNVGQLAANASQSRSKKPTPGMTGVKPMTAFGGWLRKAARRRYAQLIHRLLSANIGNRGFRPVPDGRRRPQNCLE